MKNDQECLRTVHPPCFSNSLAESDVMFGTTVSGLSNVFCGVSAGLQVCSVDMRTGWERGVRVLSALTTALRSSEYISCTSALSILNPANAQSAFQSSVG
jgi:hypothetical protein